LDIVLSGTNAGTEGKDHVLTPRVTGCIDCAKDVAEDHVGSIGSRASELRVSMLVVSSMVDDCVLCRYRSGFVTGTKCAVSDQTVPHCADSGAVFEERSALDTGAVSAD
jgi:hypothetical protein